MAKDSKPSLVNLVASATVDDLNEVLSQIHKKQLELAEVTDRLGNEIHALIQLRKVLDSKLHGKPKRRGRRAATEDANGDEAETSEAPVVDKPPSFADRIACAIAERGPMTTSRIAQRLATSEHGVRICIGRSGGRFVMNDDEEWTINE